MGLRSTNTQVDRLTVEMYNNGIIANHQQMRPKIVQYVGGPSPGFGGEQQWQDASLQSDGQDIATTVKFQAAFHIEPEFFSRSYVAKRHTWATIQDLARRSSTNPDIAASYSRMAVASHNRFMDRYLVEGGLGDIPSRDASSVSNTALPNSSTRVFANTAQNALVVLTARSMKSVLAKFWDLDIIDPTNGMPGTDQVYMVAKPYTIESFFDDDKVISGDYNEEKALARGDINNVGGIKIIRSKAMSDQAAGLYAVKTTNEVDFAQKAAASTHYAVGAADRVLFFNASTFMFGPVAQTTYNHVGAAPRFQGDIEYIYRQDYGVSRLFDNAAMIGYCKQSQATGKALLKRSSSYGSKFSNKQF